VDLPLDPAAAEELRRRVVSAVRRTCPAWLARQADDIVQTVLTQLASTVARGEGTGTFAGIYLEKAAYGATANEIRRLYRRRETSMESRADVERWASPDPDPERRAGAREIAAHIRDCLVRIGGSRCLALTLYLEGCSVPETARRLAWPPKRAENLVYRGLKDLRECLKEKGLEP
jgi:RNA polymerase sigma-70 factor, ECF subfamily